jgi:hypothetical protein
MRTTPAALSGFANNFRTNHFFAGSDASPCRAELRFL